MVLEFLAAFSDGFLMVLFDAFAVIVFRVF